MKIRIHKLKASASDPYKLFGISSHENDYRLSWAINKKLQIKFRRTNNIIVQQNNETEKLEFSVFQYIQEDQLFKMNLVSNRCPDGFLIKKMKNIDYFLQVFGITSNSYIKNIIARIKEIEIVSAVFEVLPVNFKKTWNLPPE